MDVSNELLGNYDDLRRERGWSWLELADSVENMNADLAAELRKQAASSRGSADAARDEPPRARSGPRKPRTAS